MREIINRINHVLRYGVVWVALPKEFPPRSTLYRRFWRLRDEAIFEKISFALVESNRERCGRDAHPTAVESHLKKVSDTALRWILMMASCRGGADGMFVDFLEDLPDPRTGNAQRHDLLEELTIALAASACGGESCVDFADFAGDEEVCLAAIPTSGERATEPRYV